MTNQLPDLKVYLAAPRGFCAGVVRAIDIVERALELHGKPVYVRHEIVHNKYVVEDLKQKGAIFVEELDEVPDGDRPVIFSAHGVPKSVPEAAKNRNMFYLDATCPLVSNCALMSGCVNSAQMRVGRVIRISPPRPPWPDSPPLRRVQSRSVRRRHRPLPHCRSVPKARRFCPTGNCRRTYPIRL